MSRHISFLLAWLLVLALPALAQIGSIGVNPWEETVTVQTPDGQTHPMSRSQADDAILQFLSGPSDGTLTVSDTHQSLQIVRHGGMLTETTTRPTQFVVRMIHYGRLVQCETNLKNIGTALEMYAIDHHDTYPEHLSQLVPEYLRTLPTCPSTGQSSYTYEMSGKGKASRYVMHCTGNHQAADCPAGYPVYNSQDGLVPRPK